jgi:hypothetical protein
MHGGYSDPALWTQLYSKVAETMARFEGALRPQIDALKPCRSRSHRGRGRGREGNS